MRMASWGSYATDYLLRPARNPELQNPALAFEDFLHISLGHFCKESSCLATNFSDGPANSSVSAAGGLWCPLLVDRPKSCARPHFAEAGPWNVPEPSPSPATLGCASHISPRNAGASWVFPSQAALRAALQNPGLAVFHHICRLWRLATVNRRFPTFAHVPWRRHSEVQRCWTHPAPRPP